MELIYLLYNQSFTSKNEINFSTNLTFREELFSFNIDEKLGNMIESDFFDHKISNITAFIGRNGTGKTTNICKPIMAPNWLYYDFLVFKHDNELLVFKNPLKSNVIIENKTKYVHKEIIISDLGPNDSNQEIYAKSNAELNELVRLYYSTSYSETPFSTKSINDDISTSGLISKELSLIIGKEAEKKIDDSSKDSFTNFKFNELKQQIYFLESDIGKEFSSNLNMNSKIIVSHFPKIIDYQNNQFDNIELFKELDNNSNEKNIGNGLIDITVSPGAPRIAIILWSLVCNLPSSIQNEFLDFLRRKQVSFYSDKIELDEEDVNLSVFIGSFILLLNRIISNIEDHYVLKIGNQIRFSSTIFSIPVQIAQQYVEIYTKQLKEKITNYNFKWNISSGEYSYLSLFSRLHESPYRLRNQYFLLVIDEGDTNFHPEWSRQYVKLLIDWIPKILSRAKSIQLVLTTHSPYVLSDLPSENVYTLKIENGNLKIEHPINSTFGANIHDLLANDFFLNNGFMGQFAKEKIKDLIKDLQSDRNFSIKEKNQLLATIELIGEDIIRNSLLEQYRKKFGNPTYKELLDYFNQNQDGEN